MSGDSLVIRHQDHVAELPVLPLFIEALQDLHRLVHTVEHLRQIGKKKRFDSFCENPLHWELCWTYVVLD